MAAENVAAVAGLMMTKMTEAVVVVDTGVTVTVPLNQSRLRHLHLHVRRLPH